jgi:hypothetical protein
LTAAVPSVGILVGPGVLGHIDGLHAFAERVGVAVVNTWGAKGVFRWDSPYHAGTAGLQARDFELAGLGEVELLVTSGLADAEVTSQPWSGAEVVDVEPSKLAAFAASWPHPTGTPTRPRLYTELAAIIGPMYADPASPPGMVKALSDAAPADGVVFAPPGLAGFWVARTWPTTSPGSVVVPATTEPGLAERLAVDAARAGRPATLVLGDDTPQRHASVLEGVEIVELEGDLSLPTPLLDLAGPIVAWT